MALHHGQEHDHSKTASEVSGVMFVFSRQQKGKKSVSNFDPEFTKEPCRLSPVDHNVIAAIEDEVFEGFSFTNPQMFTAS